MDGFAKVALGVALLVSVASVLFVLTQRRDADIPAPTARLGLETEANGVGEVGSKPLFRESFASVLAPEVVERPQPATVKADGVADRFRLVTVSLASDPQLSMAFIENISAKTQKCYHPGDLLEEGVTVAEILDKGAVISTRDGTFLLAFGTVLSLGGGAISPAAASGAGAGDQATLLHKFGGRRTGTNEWHFSRSAVMDYYEELKARPERLVTVFDTMAPVYNSDNRIEGYKVDIQGEAEFFKAIGFNQGDIIREVNGIPMVNRRLAENLIRRYAEDDLDFIVIKMERDGKPIQQVYHSLK